MNSLSGETGHVCEEVITDENNDDACWPQTAALHNSGGKELSKVGLQGFRAFPNFAVVTFYVLRPLNPMRKNLKVPETGKKRNLM